MFVRTAGLSASLALAANALLLPPDVSLEATASSDVASTFGIDPNHRVVEIDCPGCPFAETKDDGTLMWNQDVENSLVFDFGTGDKQDSLTVNGMKLFPPSLTLIPEPIYIHQVPSQVEESRFDLDKSFKDHPYPLDLRLTGYEFRFDSAETISEDGNELLPMSLAITSIAGIPIPPRTFHIFIIKNAEGHMSIASINTSTEPAPQPRPAEQECTDWPALCRLKALIEGKVHDIKGSFRKPGCPKMNGAGRPHREGKPPHTMQPQPHNHDGHRHHRHHSKLHRFMHAFSRVLFTVFVPILVGIAAGVFTYLVGMIIGMTIGLIWLKIRGRRRANYERVALDEEDGAVDSDDDEDRDVKYAKEVYVVEEIAEVEGEMLPPPAYRDVEEKEVVVRDESS